MAKELPKSAEGGMGGFSSRGPKRPVVKVNSNPNTTPAKSNPTANYNARVGAGEYYENVVSSKTPVVKIKTSGLGGVEGKLGGQHTGGHAGH